MGAASRALHCSRKLAGRTARSQPACCRPEARAQYCCWQKHPHIDLDRCFHLQVSLLRVPHGRVVAVPAARDRVHQLSQESAGGLNQAVVRSGRRRRKLQDPMPSCKRQNSQARTAFPQSERLSLKVAESAKHGNFAPRGAAAESFRAAIHRRRHHTAKSPPLEQYLRHKSNMHNLFHTH